MKESHKAGAARDSKQSGPIPTAPQLDTPVLSEGELGKIQEILLGKQLRAANEQMESLQNYFTQKIEELSEKHRLDMAALSSRLDETETEFDRRSRDQQKAHQVKLESSTARLSADLRSTESSLVKELAALNDSLQTTREDLVSEMGNAAQDLQSQKIDWNSLSGMFGRLATELSAGNDQTVAEAGAIPIRSNQSST